MYCTILFVYRLCLRSPASSPPRPSSTRVTQVSLGTHGIARRNLRSARSEGQDASGSAAVLGLSSGRNHPPTPVVEKKTRFLEISTDEDAEGMSFHCPHIPLIEASLTSDTNPQPRRNPPRSRDSQAAINIPPILVYDDTDDSDFIPDRPRAPRKESPSPSRKRQRVQAPEPEADSDTVSTPLSHDSDADSESMSSPLLFIVAFSDFNLHKKLPERCALRHLLASAAATGDIRAEFKGFRRTP